MHPSIVQDHPGDCPVCGMKLVKVEVPGGGGPAPEGMAGVTIDAARQQLIGLEIAHVERGPVGASLRTSGRVAVDETRIHHVNVKFSGFMERIHADFVGRPVKKGEPIFSIYSPELVAAQDEYLLALRTRATLGESGTLGRDGDALVDSARRKLELWDVPRAEIERITRTGEPSRTITFYSPATGMGATTIAARAVGLHGIVGSLQPGYQADIAVIGIGTPSEDATLVRMDCIPKAEAKQLAESGVAGYLLGTCYDEDGQVIATDMHGRLVGLALEDLRHIRTVIAVVSERGKSRAILGALRTGVIHILITETDNAMEVMRLSN